MLCSPETVAVLVRVRRVEVSAVSGAATGPDRALDSSAKTSITLDVVVLVVVVMVGCLVGWLFQKLRGLDLCVMHAPRSSSTL